MLIWSLKNSFIIKHVSYFHTLSIIIGLRDTQVSFLTIAPRCYSFSNDSVNFNWCSCVDLPFMAWVVPWWTFSICFWKVSFLLNRFSQRLQGIRFEVFFSFDIIFVLSWLSVSWCVDAICAFSFSSMVALKLHLSQQNRFLIISLNSLFLWFLNLF